MLQRDMAMSLYSLEGTLAVSLPLSFCSFFFMQIFEKKLPVVSHITFSSPSVFSLSFVLLSHFTTFPPSSSSLCVAVRRAPARVSSLHAGQEHHQGRLSAWQRGGQLLQGTLSVEDWCHPRGTEKRHLHNTDFIDFNVGDKWHHNEDQYRQWSGLKGTGWKKSCCLHS